ncbi:uncharacterized protein LOC133825616 [Humulus lupulus]|uniref:uncharacterized protein LOC133825616 n=1 Tax=Humulus lupulus TaxID=3486 RepID=UPI002B4144A1|nr:uncharacterized protein LOC133825616 [Humulus lupulus]
MEVGEGHLFIMDRIMSWNIRGLNNPKNQCEIKQLIFNKKIGLVGLLETRVKTQKLGEVYTRMFSGWWFSSNNAWHKGGRIIISWNLSIFHIDIRFCTSQLMHLEVRSNNGHECFLVTFVYAFNDVNGRDILWRDLKFLAGGHKQPWVILGDFNDILNADERVGNRVQGGSSSTFKDCIEECQLEYVKYSGCFFTWNNKQDKEGRIYSKIDRVMANQEWIIQYELTEVMFLSEGTFDHSPAILLTLKRLKGVLKDINKQGFNNIQAADNIAYQDMKSKQDCLNKDPLNEQLIEQETAARMEYIAVHKRFLSFLYQKSKLAWIKEGDDNTHLFHSSIRARRIRNKIYSIQDMACNWVDNPGAVIVALLNYYQELLGTKLENKIRVQTNIVECGAVLS